MTTGHRHFEIKTTERSLLTRTLRTRLLYTSNLEWADRSRLTFGTSDDGRAYLSILSLLHSLTGLTLRFKD